MTRRQISVDAADVTSIAVVLDSIETWLRRAPEQVIASLACSAYGTPTDRALAWTRELVSDLRYYSAVLSCAVRADNTDHPERTPL